MIEERRLKGGDRRERDEDLKGDGRDEHKRGRGMEKEGKGEGRRWLGKV